MTQQDAPKRPARCPYQHRHRISSEVIAGSPYGPVTVSAPDTFYCLLKMPKGKGGKYKWLIHETTRCAYVGNEGNCPLLKAAQAPKPDHESPPPQSTPPQSNEPFPGW